MREHLIFIIIVVLISVVGILSIIVLLRNDSVELGEKQDMQLLIEQSKK